MSESETKPMLEAILKEVRDGSAASERRFTTIERQLEQMDIRLDRIEGLALQVRSETMNLRADFKEFRSRFASNEPISVPPVTSERRDR